MAIDLGRDRLFVAELGNDSVDVVDLRDGRVIKRITGLRSPQGVAYSKAGDLVLVSNAGDGTVRMFSASTLTPVGTIRLGDDADNMRVDPHDGTVVVGYGRGGLAIIDPVKRTKIATIPLPAHPEAFQIDPTTDIAYVNVPNARQIDVIDLATRRQLATWTGFPASSNFPMVLDPASGLLAALFWNPPRMVFLNRMTGKATGILPICGDADDVYSDQGRQRLYVSCGAGEIGVFQRHAGVFKASLPVRTAPGARTSLFVPELDRLFVASRAELLRAGAAILVFRPQP
ncbi:MAG: YncE family protein [Pseudomonadota bacterium]|nr:YncE family protein [Pseudomonadota bacterium]